MATIETTPRLDTTTKHNENLSDDKIKSEPFMPKATLLLLNSGNIVSSERIKKRTNLSPEDEV